MADAVGQERAGRASFIPVRVEHEVVDHQLTANLEQAGQARQAVRALEDVFLVDLDHRQLAALGVQRVPLPGETTCGSFISAALTLTGPAHRRGRSRVPVSPSRRADAFPMDTSRSSAPGISRAAAGIAGYPAEATGDRQSCRSTGRQLTSNSLPSGSFIPTA